MRTALRILRTGAGLLALGLLIYFGQLDLRVLRDVLDHPLLVALAAVLLLLVFPLAALRWWLFTSALGFSMSYAWSLRTTFTAQFFNAFLPGAFGSDMVRLLLAYRAAQGGMSRLVFTIVADRLSGLSALILLGLCVVPALPARFHEPTYLLPWAGACVAIAGGLVVTALLAERIAGLVERLSAPIGPRLAHAIHEVVGALRAYADRWQTLVAALLLSLVQFALVLTCLVVLGTAMSFDGLSVSGYVVAGVWSIIANSLPLTPGGLGVGEAAFGQIAAALETTATGAGYANVFLATRILTVLISILGLLPYLAQRGDLFESRLAGAGDRQEAQPREGE